MDIIGYKGTEIKTKDTIKNTDKIAIIYPGYGYGLEAPIFFYLKELLVQNGFDIIGLNYRYNESKEFIKAAEDEKDKWFEYDCKAIGLEVFKAIEQYKEVVLIGKSLGTSVILNQIKSFKIPEEYKIIWLTPGTSAHEIYQLLNIIKNRSLLMLGTGDRYYNEKEIKDINNDNVTIKKVENAGHVFETEDIYKSIENISIILKEIELFIS
jgi:hypothetical protein